MEFTSAWNMTPSLGSYSSGGVCGTMCRPPSEVIRILQRHVLHFRHPFPIILPLYSMSTLCLCKNTLHPALANSMTAISLFVLFGAVYAILASYGDVGSFS